MSKKQVTIQIVIDDTEEVDSLTGRMVSVVNDLATRLGSDLYGFDVTEDDDEEPTCGDRDVIGYVCNLGPMHDTDHTDNEGHYWPIHN